VLNALSCLLGNLTAPGDYQSWLSLLRSIPMKMELSECFEPSAQKLRKPGGYPKDTIRVSTHGENLRSRLTHLYWEEETARHVNLKLSLTNKTTPFHPLPVSLSRPAHFPSLCFALVNVGQNISSQLQSWVSLTALKLSFSRSQLPWCRQSLRRLTWSWSRTSRPMPANQS
jgi:hypothetical protein